MLSPRAGAGRPPPAGAGVGQGAAGWSTLDHVSTRTTEPTDRDGPDAPDVPDGSDAADGRRGPGSSQPSGSGGGGGGGLDSSGNDPRRWKALAVTLVAGFMTLLDVSIVNVAVPSIEKGLGASGNQIQWVLTGYAVAFALVLVPSGRLGDSYGRKRLWMVGLAVFTLSSLACGLVQDPTLLAVARVAQGFGAGMLNPQNTALIQTLFSGRERARAFGLFGATVGISTAVGPVLGGALIQVVPGDYGWRSVFLINVPIGIVGLLLAWRWIPTEARRPAQRQDVGGALLLGVAVVLVLLGVQEREMLGWTLAAGAVVVALAVLYGFWRYEKHVARTDTVPIINPRLMGESSYTSGVTLGALYFGGFTAIFYTLSLYLQQSVGYTPLETGLAQIPFAVATAITAPRASRAIADRGRQITVVGLCLVVAGLLATIAVVVLLAPAVGVRWTGFLIAVPLAVAGVGSGMVISPNVTQTLATISGAESGSASGVLQTVQRIGGGLGIAVVGSVFLALVTRDAVLALSAALGTSAVLVAAALVPAVAELRRELAARAAGEDEHADTDTEGSESTHEADGADEDADARRPAADVDGPAPTSSPAVWGTVTRSAGQPLVGAFVTVTDASGHQVGRTTTDSDGSYTLPLSTGGVYVLIVAGQHLQPTAASVVVADHPVTRDLVLAAGSSISGRVATRWHASALVPATGSLDGASPTGSHPDQDDLWEGLADAVLTLTDARGEVVATTTTDSRGGYTLADLVGGAYVITAQVAGRRPVASGVTVPDSGGTTCDLHVPAGGHLSATVTAASDGRQVPEATVTLLDEQGAVAATTTTDHEGRATLADLPAGTYTLTAAGYAPVATTVRLEEDRTTSADLHLGGPR